MEVVGEKLQPPTFVIVTASDHERPYQSLLAKRSRAVRAAKKRML
jgi:hypothetical protein